jgi:hypothetical protein
MRFSPLWDSLLRLPRDDGMTMVEAGWRLSKVVATWIVVLSFVSCAHTASRPLSSSVAADAFVSESFAQFAFPSEDSSEFTWHLKSPAAYKGQPEYFWAVAWGVPEARQGKDPNGLDVGIRWQPDGPRSGTLADLIRSGEVSVHTECLTCGIPAYIPHSDRSVRAEVIGNRVTITVRGRDAVARIFPVRPDTVFFTRSAPNTVGEAQWKVAVRGSH